MEKSYLSINNYYYVIFLYILIIIDSLCNFENFFLFACLYYLFSFVLHNLM